MEWTRELTLQFIELIQDEPFLYNPRLQNRDSINRAWTRVKDAFSVPVTVAELKKKKNSMFTQYRDCLRKSNHSSGNENEMYKPSWFAFEPIHSFMRNIYDKSPKLEDLEHVDINKKPYSHDFSLENQSAHSGISTERPISPESNISMNESLSSTRDLKQRRHEMQKYMAAKRKMDRALLMMKNRDGQNENKVFDECDMYGQLLAQKLKKLDEENRLRLTNEIDNVVFKYLVAAVKSNSQMAASSSSGSK